MSRHTFVEPRHEQQLHRNGYRKKQERRLSRRVLRKRVKKQRVNEHRDRRSKVVIDPERYIFDTLGAHELGRGTEEQDAPAGITVIAADEYDEKVDECEDVDELVSAVDRTEVKRARSEFTGVIEKPALVELQDDEDVRKHQKDRAKDGRKQKSRKKVKKV